MFSKINLIPFSYLQEFVSHRQPKKRAKYELG